MSSAQHAHAALHQRRIAAGGDNDAGANHNQQYKYRGWSTSMAAVLDDPQRRNSLCALVCCGLLLSDRTRYILTEEIPNWSFRRRLNIYLPLSLYAGVLICTLLAIPADCLDGENTTASNCDDPDLGMLGAAGILKWILLAVITFLLLRGRKKRAELRMLIWNQIHGDSHNESPDSNNTNEPSSTEENGSSETFADEPATANRNDNIDNSNDTTSSYEFQSQIKDATGCCRCYSRDDKWEQEEQDFGLNPNTTMTSSERTYITNNNNRSFDNAPQPDLAKCLFRSFSHCCCACCCSAWWQCLGMCAIAQEDRELERILWRRQQRQQTQPSSTNNSLTVLPALQMDFVTFQKWEEYYPKIEELQRTQNRSIVDHSNALSRLSERILWRYYFLIVALQAFLYGVLSQNIAHVFILLGVHAQGLLLLYFVYWKWHCLDLSLDAVIKFVASGAVLGFSTGLIIEGIEVLFLGVVLYIAFALQASEEAQEQGMSFDQLFDKKHATETLQDIVKDHLGFYAAFMFVFAFVTAALTEELCKYFSYWMVLTPDEQHDKSNYRRRAAQITIGMIAASIGFATRENVSYVMGQESTSDEFWVLILRSLLPIHPICAALQSIGIVRRDVENNTHFQLGRSLLPAILLHGLYDFSLFLDSLVVFTEKEDPEDEVAPDNDSAISFGSVSPQLLMGLMFVAASLTYYFIEARSQRHRLEAMMAASVEDEEIQLQELPQQEVGMKGDSPEPGAFTLT